MQEQPRQTLLPGLKLSYDHPHFPRAVFYMEGQGSTCENSQGSNSGS